MKRLYKGIKKTVTEINRNRHLHANILVNTKTDKVWADFFPDCNSYNAYNKPEIKCFMTWKAYPIEENKIRMIDINDGIINNYYSTRLED